MSKSGGYDARLLDQAPTVEKAQARQGYDVDILAPHDVEARSSSHGQQPVPVDTQSHRRTSQPLSPVKARPWWKTTKGRVILGILLLVIVAAAVGGGVGGALGHKSKSPTASAAAASATSTSSSGGTDQSGGGGNDGSDTQGITPVSVSSGSQIPAFATAATTAALGGFSGAAFATTLRSG